MSSSLLPESIENIPDLYETEGVLDPIVHLKFFTPDSNFTWYVIELSKEDRNTCFGYVVGLEKELGYFTIEELESVCGSMGLKVERDLLFQPTRFSEIKATNT